MNELNLNKGDICFLVVNDNIKEMSVASVRNYKFGRKAYFIKDENGIQFKLSFSEYGFPNYKTWQDAAMNVTFRKLVSSMKDAEKTVVAYKKEK